VSYAQTSPCMYSENRSHPLTTPFHLLLPTCLPVRSLTLTRIMHNSCVVQPSGLFLSVQAYRIP